jgi:quercetin dioxygenase-like cupin family protein
MTAPLARRLPLLLTGLMMTVFAQVPSQQATPQPNPNFTGNITRLTETPPGVITYIKFEAGARTKWHVHEKGQMILVEDGVALEQKKGGPIVELHAGETIWCPAGVAHWHGASPEKGGTQYNVTRGGITWLEQVTDEEFHGKPVRK